MNETFELLEYIHETACMGRKATEKLLQDLKNKDNKIKKILEDELKEYQNFEKETEKLLHKNKVIAKDPSIFSVLMADTSMKLEIMKDNSDSKIAEMLIQGFNMGKTKLEKKKKQFEKESDKNILKLNDELNKFQDKQLELLKEFL